MSTSPAPRGVPHGTSDSVCLTPSPSPVFTPKRSPVSTLQRHLSEGSSHEASCSGRNSENVSSCLIPHAITLVTALELYHTHCYLCDATSLLSCSLTSKRWRRSIFVLLSIRSIHCIYRLRKWVFSHVTLFSGSQPHEIETTILNRFVKSYPWYCLSQKAWSNLIHNALWITNSTWGRKEHRCI